MIEITLPLPPDRANAREHFRATHKKKVAYYAKAERALREQCEWVLVVVTGEPRIRAEVPCSERMRLDATFYLWNKMDKGNLVARLKFVEDILVRFGLLVDDNERWLDLQMPRQVIDRENRRVEVVLTPAGDVT